MAATDPQSPTAAVLLIGNELLSGRTQDTNLAAIARFLAPFGIDVCEVRVVPDVEAEIVAALNALRARYTYVFTTGGIGPPMTISPLTRSPGPLACPSATTPRP
ncbi:MAG TPA: molybdopterin-binding protein [Rhizomicrobium sp.]|jgi:molybdopterin-biosynthesis enzyme MoeA-like protein